ncbi:MAG: hypothetical protein NVS3B21_03040 [Acidimicrobiales bacterium]
MVKATVVAAAVGLSFATATPAFADYGPTTPGDVGGLQGSQPPSPTPVSLPNQDLSPSRPATPNATGTATSGSSLPFTGGDVEGLSLIGLGLVGTGLAARRIGRRRVTAA